MFPILARISPDKAFRDGPITKHWEISFGFYSKHIGGSHRISILKITQLGLLMQAPSNLEIDHKLKVYLPDRTSVGALIVRRHDDHYDAVFANPISLVVLRALRFGGVGGSPIFNYDDGSVARCVRPNRALVPELLLWIALVITVFIVSIFVFALASLPVLI